MQDRRKNRRLNLTISLQLERLNDGGVSSVRHAVVDVYDISTVGLGFHSDEELAIGTYYDAKIEIWTKEVIETVVEIVRCESTEQGYDYGCVFIGLMDQDAIKIEIYDLFNQAEV